jgi:hypothetical protein
MFWLPVVGLADLRGDATLLAEIYQVRGGVSIQEL